MHLTLLNFTATQFKNIASCQLAFSKRFNCFTGKNGSGKTNLLDAIYYLSICKSNFNLGDKQLIQNSKDFFRLEGNYQRQEDAVKIEMACHQNKQKKLVNNGQKISRRQAHIGQLPVLFIAPDDIALVKGYSNDRRKTVDKVLCQTNAGYLNHLSTCQQVLQQRNHHLKNCNRQPDFTLLEAYNQKLIPATNFVFAARKAFLNTLDEFFKSIYQSISGNNEVASYQYISSLFEDSYQQLLKNSQLDDMYAQRTTVGIHKDDVNFLINEQAAKNYGSQGQQKNFLIAFKLACAQYMAEKSKKTPILLLDDIFDKLDANRVTALLQVLQRENFGQVFITDTGIDRMQMILNTLSVNKKFFKVEAGAVNEI